LFLATISADASLGKNKGTFKQMFDYFEQELLR
jgi:hypothetical protein